MNLLALAQIQLSSMSIGQMAIAVVIVAAIIALMFVALNKFGIAIPDWVVQIFWILVVAVCVILAIKFLIGMF